MSPPPICNIAGGVIFFFFFNYNKTETRIFLLRGGFYIQLRSIRLNENLVYV